VLHVGLELRLHGGFRREAILQEAHIPAQVDGSEMSVRFRIEAVVRLLVAVRGPWLLTGLKAGRLLLEDLLACLGHGGAGRSQVVKILLSELWTVLHSLSLLNLESFTPRRHRVLLVWRDPRDLSITVSTELEVLGTILIHGAWRQLARNRLLLVLPWCDWHGVGNHP